MSSSIALPPVDILPDPDASLSDLVRFARAFDPTEHFHQLWGAAYSDNARGLWQARLHSFQAADAPPTGPAPELLLCLAYHVALGPHLGTPAALQLPFLRWLTAGIRKALQP